MKTWKNFRVLVLLQANRAFQLFQPAICHRWSFRHRFSVPFCEQEKKFFFKQKKKKWRKEPLILGPLYYLTPPLKLSRELSKETFPRHVTDWMFARISTRHRGLSVLFRLRGGRGRGFIIQDYGTCGNVWENGRERLLSERKTQRLLRRSPTKPLLRFTSPSLLMKGVL